MVDIENNIWNKKYLKALLQKSPLYMADAIESNEALKDCAIVFSISTINLQDKKSDNG